MLSLALLTASALCSTASAKSWGPQIGVYWPSYSAASDPVNTLDFTKLTHADWFVAVPQRHSYDLSFPAPANPSTMKTMTTNAKKQKASVSLTIGGWTGSQYFSSLVSNSTGRAAFSKSIYKTIKKYKLNGIEIDWEYPNGAGIGCNVVSAKDTQNFILFVKQLRKTVGPSYRLSAAVNLFGLYDTDGTTYTKDLSVLAANLDFISLMNYDVYGPWTATSGPNGPLASTCATDEGAGASAIDGVARWVSYGFKKSQIVLGAPAYGYVYATAKGGLVSTRTVSGSSSKLYQKVIAAAPQGSASDDKPGKDICGNQQGYGAVWNYDALITTGKLSKDGTTGLGDYERYWDSCSSTPFLYNTKTGYLYTYDDAQSIKIKAAWAKKQGLAGMIFFDASGDYKSQLVNAARAGFLGSSASQAKSRKLRAQAHKKASKKLSI
ncbi:glycoside hydrolase family 18 protein [Mixia osmundae IAM 14324]|uniref:GH18 domain-containing protein n=1 Tax=Mixia osmundae (strain CBS 9802 / IAM 14324 / JCM 22182 / KY 12970) TaxID=764103 RepID=G7DUW6_MIXOS|nr:glycoside hydrolase family 18 protein [Mixia osmundae IAM 14324]KEI37407.1 glycoside hydrolase family 18 protein [Mixia osmundae IAM 14324]GAA94376.1 hypothetical protein E5Q_01027 [Mixia osmundae IAM 14324]